MKAVKFYNDTKTDFAHKWNNEVYKFEAGSTTMLEEPLANHFAKHLAIRELNKLNKITDSQHMPPMVKKFIIASDVEAASKEKLETAILNQPKKKKKAVKKVVKEPSSEESFEGLKE